MKDHESDNNKIKFNGTPRNIDDVGNKAAIQQGTGGGYGYLATERYFQKYWHLLPSDKYDLCNIMEQVYNYTQDTSIGIHGSKLKAEATTLSGLASTLSTKAGELEGKLNADGEDAAKALVTALKNAASNPGSSDGLKELLGELSGANILELVAQAQKVLAKYNAVETAYNAVKNDPKAKAQQTQFGQVKTAFDALQKEFNKIKRLDKYHLVTVPSILRNG